MSKYRNWCGSWQSQGPEAELDPANPFTTFKHTKVKIQKPSKFSQVMAFYFLFQSLPEQLFVLDYYKNLVSFCLQKPTACKHSRS